MSKVSLINRDLKRRKIVKKFAAQRAEIFAVINDKNISEEDWVEVRDNLQYDFLQDGHFAELKQTEMLRERLTLANEMRDYIGKFFSVEYVRKNVLKQNDREIEDMDKQIKNEIDDGIIASPTAQSTDTENL